MRAARSALKITAAIVLAGTLTACSRGSSPSPSTTSRPPAKVVEGGTLRLGLGGPVQPDPAAANLGSPADLMVLDLLYDGLTRLGADGQAEPALAATWTPDPTLSTWVFTLAPGASFAHGRAITSADVIASLEHVARGGDASLAALRLEAISGFRAFVDGTAVHLVGLTAPDSTTVSVALDTPMSVLPVLLASPQYGIVDVASLQAATSERDLSELDLSGDWSVRSAKAGTLTLARRKGRPGHLAAIQLRSYKTSDAAYDAFDQGAADWATVPVAQYGDAVDRYGEDAFQPFHAELFFGMRLTSPNLANLELRKAIAQAIDRVAIVRAVYPDVAVPLSRIVPAGLAGAKPNSCADCGYPHDVESAQAILRAAFPDGNVPTVVIDFDESPAQDAMAKIVARNLELAGVPTQLRPKPLEEYKAFVVSGSQELFSFGWIGGYASPDAYLAPLFGSAANDNLTGYRHPNVDAGLAAARANPDRVSSARQWSEVERQVLADAVVVPVAQFRTEVVIGSRVQALVHGIDGSVDWSGVWVSDGV